MNINPNVIILSGVVEKREDKIEKGKNNEPDFIDRRINFKIGDVNASFSLPMPGDHQADLFEAFPAGQSVLFEITPVDTRPEPAAEPATETVTAETDEADVNAAIAGGWYGGPIG